ncbi:MAG: hypothetical protein AAGF99_00440 [Bacteroidota bacterium]
MTLEIFYERCRVVPPGAAGVLSEAALRSRLVEALEKVSSECGVPRVGVAFDRDGSVVVPWGMRHVLTPPVYAGDVSLSAAYVDDEHRLTVTGSNVPFSVDVECYPPTPPAVGAEGTSLAWEVPFGDVVLNYVLSELWAPVDPNQARLYYSRFEQGKLDLKRRARENADLADNMTPYVPSDAITGVPVYSKVEQEPETTTGTVDAEELTPAQMQALLDIIANPPPAN